VVTGIAGVHAVIQAPSGAFGGNVLIASWQSGTLIRVDTAGVTTELASGLSLTNYDGNILEPSPDGSVLFVADRLANRLVCIEPI
jgi:sugar lactone lactonase YvrE